ncbi:uncharacterized protein LOC115349846 [Aquila chrysaetos chrysaetos]|uniref:uncharacterized protein LOC115349846 n=1 Tax=Aquila chrysaetos chrysaetos TaxID=223781 RepID=UPI0011769D56|nr:uncharacterized protein LOC115349846 [Aquila chrysaetos chrysaetos]
MGGTAQRPDAALLSAGFGGEGTPGLCNPREATLPGRVLARRGGQRTTSGGIRVEGQREMPKRQLKSNFRNALLLFLSPESEPFSGGDCFCLFFLPNSKTFAADFRPGEQSQVQRLRAGRKHVPPHTSGLRKPIMGSNSQGVLIFSKEAMWFEAPCTFHGGPACNRRALLWTGVTGRPSPDRTDPSVDQYNLQLNSKEKQQQVFSPRRKCKWKTHGPSRCNSHGSIP